MTAINHSIIDLRYAQTISNVDLSLCLDSISEEQTGMDIFMHTNVRMYSDGQRHWPTLALVTATCQVMVYYFPFDSQVTMQIIVQCNAPPPQKKKKKKKVPGIKTEYQYLMVQNNTIMHI